MTVLIYINVMTVHATAFLDSFWASPLVQLSILQHIPMPPPHENGPIAPMGQVLLDILRTTFGLMQTI